MGFCPECGVQLADDARFCVECGTSIKSPLGAPAPIKTANVATPGSVPAPRVSVATPKGGGGTRSIMVAAIVVVAIGLIWWGLRNEDPPSAGSSASASPTGELAAPAAPSTIATAPEQPDGPSPDLLAATGEWTVDPNDPLYSSSDSNTLSLHREASQLQGVGPEGATLRFWEQGAAIVGEATDVDGKIWTLSWQWLEPGVRAKMGASNGQDSHQVTLIRPSAALESTAPTPPVGAALFEAQGDLNSDGSPETVRVLGLSPAAEANSDADKQIEILGSGGSVLFRSEVFQEPFRTDLDDMAENPEQKAGLHILDSANGFPVVRVIFVCRSGNFVEFQFNGQTYELVTTGN